MTPQWGAPIGEAHSAAGVEQHFTGRFQVAVGVVEEGREEDVAAVALAEEVVGEFERGLAGGVGPGPGRTGRGAGS